MDTTSGVETAPGTSPLARGRSRVWNEFTIIGEGNKVQCRHCKDSLSYSHSHSTSSMLKHLKRKHHMDLYPESVEGGNDAQKNAPKSSPEKGKSQKKSAKPKKQPIYQQEEEQFPIPSIQHDPLQFVDQMCVRMKWADHGETFLKTFSVMYNEESYTDCILVAEKQMFKGHRMVLSSASELLDEMFKMTPSGVQQPIIFLHNVKAMELRVLLDFIYKGEVAIPPSLIPGLVKVGSDLKVKGLSDFVWNDQLASSIFQGYPNNNNNTGIQQQQQSVHYTENIIQEAVATKSAPSGDVCDSGDSSSVKPATFNIGQSSISPRYMFANKSNPQQTGYSPVLGKTYARLVPTNRPVTTTQSSTIGFRISDNDNVSMLEHCGPSQVKRMKILNTAESTQASSLGSPNSSQFVTSFENKKSSTTTNIPDTVLMVTNQGETVLSTSQGGITLMTPNSISLPVSFSIKDDQSQSGHSQYVSNQPVTILSQCNDGSHMDEVVYSITTTEVPGGGHEVLMSAMDQSPIVVYDTVSGSDGSTDKKLFQEDER